MQRNYLIVGGIILLLILGFFLFRGEGTTTTDAADALTPASSFDHAHGMAVDISDANKVYVATHDGLYLLRDDADLFQVGKTRDDLMGFSQHPTEADVFFSSGHPARGGNIGFQKTTDGGISWERISSGLGGPVDFHAMAVSAANPDIVYGFFGGRLHRSQDGGASWEYTAGAVAPYSLSTSYTDENVVYAATQDGVQVSADKGTTWASLSPALEEGAVSTFTLHPQDKDYALVFSERLGGLGKSTDGGVSWEKIGESFGGESVLYIAFSRTESGIVYALTDRSSLYKSADRGGAWAKVR